MTGSKEMQFALGTLLLLLGGCLGVGLYGEREHRQRSRVSEALSELLRLKDAIPTRATPGERTSLSLPSRHHEERDDDVNEFPKTTDFSVDIVGDRIVATFSADQEAVSGGTIWIARSGPAGSKVSCGGTLPDKYLPMPCRKGE